LFPGNLCEYIKAEHLFNMNRNHGNYLQHSQVNLQRIEIEARIVRRLQRLDLESLQQLDAATKEAEVASFGQQSEAVNSVSDEVSDEVADEVADKGAVVLPPKGITRRQALLRVVAGGTAVATAGYLATRPDTGNIDRALNDPENRVERGQVAALQTLLTLYEMMDRVGLDRLIISAILAIGFSVEGLRGGATALRAGLNLISSLLDRFEAAAPRIIAGIQAAEEVVQTVNRQMQRLEDLMGAVLQETAPFTEAVDQFVQTLLGYLPFGIGDRIRNTIQGMGEVVGFLPATARLLGEQLLVPMRAWFPKEGEGDNDGDVRTALFTPTRTQVLDPARNMLDHIVNFAEQWNAELAQPLEKAVAQRHAVRLQIADYKREHSIL
jgi:hypothetical protein